MAAADKKLTQHLVMLLEQKPEVTRELIKVPNNDGFKPSELAKRSNNKMGYKILQAYEEE